MINVNGKSYPTISDIMKVPENERKGEDYLNKMSGIFLVTSSSFKNTSTGNVFTQATVCDDKKVANVKIWEKVEAGSLIFSHYEYSSTYHSFSLKPIRIVNAEKAPEIAEALTPHFDVGNLERCLKYLIKSVENVHLRKLLEEIFRKDSQFYTSFVNATAASQNHHVGRGGLFFHTISMTKIALNLISSYPNLNRDLIVTGCLIHDIGKVETYKDAPTFDYTDEGKLENHIVLGVKMLARFIDRIPDFPPELESILTHIIASHHGRLEFGSPVTPKIPEAMVVNFADEIDAKLNAVFEVFDEMETNNWEKVEMLKSDIFKFEI
ncbi:3'-5' exoribonuclease YhaM family protein [Mesoaciditoga lauensis]|uniref:3'-5' exoribonuclease YhaM family protein n=1 Tax=Mesoaciditoga lauensis TaxID=1495039 RepID=UPI00068F2642|nr:HD domain-containing protein [Mesoaciditoga lauensis]